MKEKVGFMGLGIMGLPMAGHIARAGYPLAVYNRTTEKSEALAALGASVASSPRALAESCEVIVAMVTGPEALDALLWGPEGAAEGLSESKRFANMSTVSPRFSIDLNRKLSALGVTFIDAPVSGSKKPAEDATLLILAGGPREEVERLTPLFETMGKRVVYCGEAGQGSMMKMTINLLLGIMMEGASETLNFGRAGGLSFETMFEVIFGGPLNCALYQMKAQMLEENDFPVSFPLKHMTKDLKFTLDTAYETGAPLPVGQMLLHLYRMGVGQEWGDLDFAAILKVLEHMNAIEKK